MAASKMISSITLRDRLLSTACHAIRRLPAGRRTLLEVCRKAVGNPERFVLSDNHFRFVVDFLDDDVATRVALSRTYEPVVGALFLGNVTKGQTVIDAGANKGYYSLLAALRVGNTGRVIAIEPEPRNLEDLESLVVLNDVPQLTIVGKAVSHATGTAQFANPGWDERNSAWGQIVRGGTDTKGGIVTVHTCSLDEELAQMGIERVDMIKVDIQGGEKEAIPGMRRLLKGHAIKSMLLELHDMQLDADECHAILEEIHSAGYSGRGYAQDEFSDSEALAALNIGKALPLQDRGIASRDYSHVKRFSTPGYKKPLQFLLRPTDTPLD